MLVALSTLGRVFIDIGVTVVLTLACAGMILGTKKLTDRDAVDR